MVSALFVCSLSADVPDARKQAAAEGGARTAEGRQRTAASIWRMTGQGPAHGSFGLFGVQVRSAQAWPAGTLPPQLAVALSAVCPAPGFGAYAPEHSCARWDVTPSERPDEMNAPADPLVAAFLIPRYGLPLALQSSVWPTAAESLMPGIAGGSARAEMLAMIPQLKKVFVQEGVPQQWVWMAEVESALNPRARSSAGAAGLFQLMPGTARRFGLRTAPFDDRMEPAKSAGAAAQYLKILHREFGCWSLALAAYNAGEGRVKEIMKKRQASTFSEVERYLPSETRAYVPKVMAIVALREDQLHGVPGAYWMP